MLSGNNDTVEVGSMLALHPRVVEAVWQAVEAFIPRHVAPPHPLGCHRPRIADRVCFEGILRRLVTGCSWDVAGRISQAGETTLRRRRDEWVAAGVFDRLVEHALGAYDRIIGLDLSDCAIDGSLHKAPFGGDGTGPNPTDRGKQGWKWSMLTDRWGIPLGWTVEGANRHDSALLGPTLAATAARGLLTDIDTLHLDRGYDNSVVRHLVAAAGIEDLVCAKRRKPGTATGTTRLPLGLRWPIERTNSWLSNFGQLRRNTDRHAAHRPAQFALAVVLIITVKLIKWADRWA